MSGLVPFNRNNRSSMQTRGFDDFYNMLDDFFSDIRSPRSIMYDSFKIDVQDNEGSYCIEAELPGVNKEDISLDLSDGHLTIAVQHEESTEDKTKNYVHKERRFGTMQRSIYLADVKNDGAAAKFENGILEITVLKETPSAKSNKIDIQ